MQKKRKNPEALLQTRVRKMLMHRAPDLFWIGGAAGLRLNGATLMKAKAAGCLRRGWPDLTFMNRGRAYFIELKSSTGSLTTEQNDFAWECTRDDVGHWARCRSVEEVEETLTRWGFELKKETDFNILIDDDLSFAEAFE